MLSGLAVVPTAPLLVGRVNPVLPAPLDEVRLATADTLARLGAPEVVVLVAGSDRAGVAEEARASLAGLGITDVTDDHPVDAALVAASAAATGLAVDAPPRLATDVAVLVLLCAEHGPTAPIVPVTVERAAEPEDLMATGRGIAAAIAADQRRVAVVVAGDLGAGLSDRAPRHRIDGADDWESRALDVIDSGRLDGLARLGPAAAATMGSRGWAPLMVAAGITAGARIGVVRRSYHAPLGVGYLTAHGS